MMGMSASLRTADWKSSALLRVWYKKEITMKQKSQSTVKHKIKHWDILKNETVLALLQIKMNYEVPFENISLERAFQ